MRGHRSEENLPMEDISGIDICCVIVLDFLFDNCQL
jgi:hypothetical protein